MKIPETVHVGDVLADQIKVSATDPELFDIPVSLTPAIPIGWSLAWANEWKARTHAMWRWAQVVYDRPDGETMIRAPARVVVTCLPEEMALYHMPRLRACVDAANQMMRQAAVKAHAQEIEVSERLKAAQAVFRKGGR